MALLTHPNGTQADVPDDLVDRFVSLGWSKPSEKKPEPKRPATRKKSD